MDPRQNKEIERQASSAKNGGRYRYQDTPIHSTDGGPADVVKDLSSLSGPAAGRWWEHREPTFAQEQGQRFDDAARRKGKRSVAQDLAYCGEPISENIVETPDGYWICRNATIGRSGFQVYKAREVADPEGLLEDYGPEESVELWRDPGEVFSRSTIASFEGKSLTLGHPQELLNPDTERDHIVGHIQNVRKGSEVLDSGNWPLIADLIVKDRAAIEAIQSGKTELSCGYSYVLAREGNRFDQREILGNHVALVPRGRAGSEVRVEVGALAAGVHDDKDAENVWGGNR